MIKRSNTVKVVIFTSLIILSTHNLSFSSTKEILKQGITGFGAGAVGSQIENPLAAGAAGAGVNIVGGALFDTLLGNGSQSNNPQPTHTTTERVIVREVPKETIIIKEVPSEPIIIKEKVYIDRHKKRKKKKKQYQKGYQAGYSIGFEQGRDAGFKEAHEKLRSKVEQARQIYILNGYDMAYREMAEHCQNKLEDE